MTEKSKIDKWDAALEELGAAHTGPVDNFDPQVVRR
jgi:hypothetical protein